MIPPKSITERATPSWRRCAILIAGILFGVAPTLAWSQTADDLVADCGAIAPRGGGKNDSKAINNCLCTQKRAILTEGQFFLKQPLFFPRKAKTPDPAQCTFAEVSDVVLAGQGDTTVLNIKADCGAGHWPFVAGTESSPNPKYEVVVSAFKAQRSTIRDLKIDLANLRQDCNPAWRGNFAVQVHTSPGSVVSGLTIAGNQTTTGGANGGGINAINSPGTRVANNVIRDVGFTLEAGTTSTGNAGIRMDNSGCDGPACSTVDGNVIQRAAFGIEVSNQGAAAGYSGDGSGTRVTDNVIAGAAKITNCPNCAPGRAIKLQACGTADIVPLRNLAVTDNRARDFGGKNQNNVLTANGSGLDLICGIQNGIFMNNRIDGSDSAAEFGLQIRDGFAPILPAGPAQKNTGNSFYRNFFRSGSNTPQCKINGKDVCSDVHFERNVPDQIGLTRTLSGKGDNDYRNIRAD